VRTNVLTGATRCLVSILTLVPCVFHLDDPCASFAGSRKTLCVGLLDVTARCVIPSSLDAQEAVSLKLLKRHLNIRYKRLRPKRPPSIYFAKRAGSVGYITQGLTAQLIVLADNTGRILREHLAAGTRPNELNPSYPADRLNDRWPAEGRDGIQDMETLAGVLEAVAEKLMRLARAPLSEIVAGMSELFGERIGEEIRAILTKRFDMRAGTTTNLVQTATGNVKAPAIVRAAPDVRSVPRHNFHPVRIEDDDAG
jgi:hypothetical protein